MTTFPSTFLDINVTGNNHMHCVSCGGKQVYLRINSLDLLSEASVRLTSLINCD